MGDYKNSQEQTYIQYNNPEEVKSLDVPVWNSPYGIVPSGATGRHLYKYAPPKNPKYSLCFGGKEPENHFITDPTHKQLPDHSSRFGYARCQLGYCSGHWPGRYIEPDLCSEYDPQPPGMAPERFYNSNHQGPFNVNSQAIEDYNYWKNIGMNYPSWWKYPGEPKDRL